MNSLIKKALIFLLVMAVVAAGGWYGRKAYKKATERRAVAEAGHYLEKNDIRNAALCLQRALQVNPLSVPACQMMGDMLEAGGLPAALNWRVRAAQLEPNNMTNRLVWAQTALKLGDLKSAGNALSGVNEKAKATADYHKLAGALAWSLKERDAADKEYREALRLEPGNLAIILNLDTINLASSNLETAASARASLERVATNSEFRLVALRYLMADASAHKLYAKATSYSSEIINGTNATIGDKIDHLQLLHLSSSPDFAPWLASMKQDSTHAPVEAAALGKWMAATGSSTTALQWLQTLPESIQTNQPVPLIMADCHVASGDWAGLIAMAGKQDWGESDCFRVALISLGQRSLHEDAASQTSWRKALHLAEHRLDRLSHLAQVTAGWKWDAENTEVLKAVIDEFPKERWAQDQLVDRLYTAGNTRELGDLLAKVYASNNNDPRLKNNLANIFLLRRAELDTAYRLAHEAYDTSPENPFFTSTYAYSLLLQNKQDEAVKVFSGIKPEYLQIPSVAAYYGVVEAQSGHKDLAKAPLELAATAKLLPEEKEIVRQAQARL